MQPLLKWQCTYMGHGKQLQAQVKNSTLWYLTAVDETRSSAVFVTMHMSVRWSFTSVLNPQWVVLRQIDWPSRFIQFITQHDTYAEAREQCPLTLQSLVNDDYIVPTGTKYG